MPTPPQADDVCAMPPDDPTQDAPKPAAPVPTGPVRLINFGEGDHTFELPKLGPDGKPLRGPATMAVRDGAPVATPGKPLVDYIRLGSASNRQDGGVSPELNLTGPAFERLIAAPSQRAVLAELVNSGEVSLFGASL